MRKPHLLIACLLLIGFASSASARQRFDVHARAALVAAAVHLFKEVRSDTKIGVEAGPAAAPLFAEHGEAIAAAVGGKALAPGRSGVRCIYGTDAQGYNTRDCRLDGFDYLLQPVSIEVTDDGAVACFMKIDQPGRRPHGQMLRVKLARSQDRWEVTRVDLLGES